MTLSSEAPGSEIETEEWSYEWDIFQNDDERSLRGWMAPVRLEDVAGKDVLECGCGGGAHTRFFSAIARHVTAVDLNTVALTSSKLGDLENVEFVEADLTHFDLGRTFDVVVCVGVIHHTDDPDAVFANLVRHLRPGGTVVVWTYSSEGNWLVRNGVEPIRRYLLVRLSRKMVRRLAFVTTALLYPIVHSVYRLPFLSFLPFYEYFGMFRILQFRHNHLNVFDKLNAPQTRFTTLAKCREWLKNERLDPDSVRIRRHLGVSYTVVASSRADADTPA